MVFCIWRDAWKILEARAVLVAWIVIWDMSSLRGAKLL